MTVTTTGPGGWLGATPAGASCFLYQSSAVDPSTGVSDGFLVLIAQPSEAFGRAMGLPTDPHMNGSGTWVPPDEISIAWMVDNGSYALTGFPGLDAAAGQDKNPNPIFIMPQAFNPKSPFANPHAFLGPPSTRFGQLISQQAQDLALAVKAFGSVMGAAVTVQTTLSVIAAAVPGTLGAIAAAAAAVGTSVITSVTAAVSSALASTGVGIIPAAAFAVVMGILDGIAAAYPAESPSLHIAKPINGESPVRVWVRESGALKGYRFMTGNPNRAVPPDPPDFGTNVVAQLGAELGDVDAETFFAGLVYLRTALNAGELDLLWTARVSPQGIAAFRAARSSGAAVSDAIRAAAAFPLPTPLELKLQSILPPGALPLPITQSADALACLASAHATNEQLTESYLASGALQSALGPDKTPLTAVQVQSLVDTIRSETGGPRPRLNISSALHKVSVGPAYTFTLPPSKLANVTRGAGYGLPSSNLHALAPKSASSSSSSSGGGGLVVLLAVAGGLFAASRMRR